MNLAIRRFKVYLRLAIVTLVLGAVGIVLFMNRSNAVSVWFFGLTNANQPVNVVWLMLSTAAGTITAWRLFAFSHGLWRDLRELKRETALQAVAEQQRQRAVELELRERRLAERVDGPPADGNGESAMSKV